MTQENTLHEMHAERKDSLGPVSHWISCTQLQWSHTGARDMAVVPSGEWLFTELHNKKAPFLGGKELSQT